MNGHEDYWFSDARKADPLTGPTKRPTNVNIYYHPFQVNFKETYDKYT